MVSPPRTSKSNTWGEGQQRQCRDWNKLKEWAEMHNACFSYINETQGVKSMFDRYKWCPQNSPYGATMRSVPGFSDDWDSQTLKDIDILTAYWEGLWSVAVVVAFVEGSSLPIRTIAFLIILSGVMTRWLNRVRHNTFQYTSYRYHLSHSLSRIDLYRLPLCSE